MNLQYTDLCSVQLRGIQTFCSFPTSGVIYPRPHYPNSGTLNCAWTPSGDCSQQLLANSILIKEKNNKKRKPWRRGGEKQVLEDSLLLKCWRLLYWARLDIRHHREGWIQRDHLRCQLQRGVAQPSFRTWEHPEPTSLLKGHILTPGGSGIEKEITLNRHDRQHSQLYIYCFNMIHPFFPQCLRRTKTHTDVRNSRHGFLPMQFALRELSLNA